MEYCATGITCNTYNTQYIIYHLQGIVYILVAKYFTKKKNKTKNKNSENLLRKLSIGKLLENYSIQQQLFYNIENHDVDVEDQPEIVILLMMANRKLLLWSKILYELLSL